jgi:glycosyltransferase involved in cell wall biosynthesis
MKVLYIVNFFPPEYVGGAEVAAFNSCHGLLQRGIECTVLSINARSPQHTDQEYVFKGVKVRQVGYYHTGPQILKVFDPLIYRRIVQELQVVRPDLVHVHNVSGTSLAPFVACQRLGLPVVLTLHDHWLLCPNNMLFRRNGVLCDPAMAHPPCGDCYRRYDFWGVIPFRRQIYAWLTQDVQCFISPGQRLIELHVAAGYQRARFRLLRYGLGSSFTDGAPSVPEPAWMNESRYANVMLFAGQIVEIKGALVLAKALPLLERYVERFHLWVAGAGDDASVNALRRFAPNPVQLLGRLNFYELKALYTAAGLTVVPSIWYDNSPVVIAESLLAGTPVLGADIGGIPELIQEGKTGYVFPAGDSVALAEKAILHFARSVGERQAMRQAAIQWAKENLTLERHVDGLLDIYREVVG